MKYSEEYKNDQIYWQQFDMDTKDLPIERLQLLKNSAEEQRIKDLLRVSLGESVSHLGSIVGLDYYVIYHLLKNGTKLNLEYVETDSLKVIDSLKWESEQDNGNICIIEIKEGKQLPDNFDEICEKMGFTAIILNEELPTKYRINLINH